MSSYDIFKHIDILQVDYLIVDVFMPVAVVWKIVSQFGMEQPYVAVVQVADFCHIASIIKLVKYRCSLDC